MNRIEKKENGDNSRLVVLSVLDMIKEGGSYPIKGSGFSMRLSSTDVANLGFI